MNFKEIPLFYIISSSEKQDILGRVFRKIVERFPDFNPKTLLSDMYSGYYNAFCFVLDYDLQWLWCAWHFSRAIYSNMKTKFIKQLTLSLMLVFQVSIAQDSVTGIVTDSDGVPLPGASVVVEGTSSGVTTDFDGNYQINVSQGETLIVSFVGYLDQVINVDASVINVSMQLQSELDEVVVVAYGTQSKASLTGSVSVIGS